MSTLSCSVNRNSSMNCSDDTDTHAETALDRAGAGAVLARKAGMPFQSPLGNASGIDPTDEWLSLMEIV